MSTRRGAQGGGRLQVYFLPEARPWSLRGGIQRTNMQESYKATTRCGPAAARPCGAARSAYIGMHESGLAPVAYVCAQTRDGCTCLQVLRFGTAACRTCHESDLDVAEFEF